MKLHDILNILINSIKSHYKLNLLVCLVLTLTLWALAEVEIWKGIVLFLAMYPIFTINDLSIDYISSKSLKPQYAVMAMAVSAIAYTFSITVFVYVCISLDIF